MPAAPKIWADISSVEYSGTLSTEAGWIEFAPSEPVQWELTLHPLQEYKPYGGAASEAFKGRPYVGGQLCFVRIYMQGEWGLWTSPDLLIDQYTFTDGVPKISGRCFSALFDLHRQGFSDVESTEAGGLVFSHTPLAEVLNSFGVNEHEFNHVNWLIDHMHRIGNGRQIIEDLIGDFGEWGFYSGRTFTVEPYSLIGSAPVASLVDELDLEDPVGFRRSSWALYNRAILHKVAPPSAAVEAARTEVSSEVSAEGPGIAGTIGSMNPPPPQRLDLDPPIRYGRLHFECVRGKLEGVVWLDEGDNPINQTPSEVHQGPGEAHAVQFLYDIPTSELAFEKGPFVPSYRAWVDGQEKKSSPQFDLNPVNFFRVANDGTTQEGGLFVRPAPIPNVTTALARESDAALAAQITLDRGIVEGEILAAKMELDPTRLQRGKWVSVTDHGLGCSNRPFKLLRNRLTWSEGSGSRDDPGDTGTMHLELSSPH